MTIYMYSGTPGSGKSLHAANDIRFSLNRRTPRPVLGNFEIAANAPVKNLDLYHYMPNDKLDVDFLTEFATDYWDSGVKSFREDWILLVVDECQLLFNSRTWNAKTRLRWLGFMTQHRKYGYKIILIAQSAKMVDNQFRMLVEYEVNHRKLKSMGFIGWLLSLPFGGRLFMWVTYLFQSQERLGSQWYMYKKKDADMYDSYKRFEGNADTKKFTG